MDVDTSLLRTFVALAEERHFGRVAERLLVSQQAVSKRLIRLEAVVGLPLVVRTRRDVSLTDAGSRFLPEARAVIDAVDHAEAALLPPTKPLRIDALDEHLALLPHVRHVAAESALPIEVLMREYRSDPLTALRSGAVDAAFGRAGTVAGSWPRDVECRTALLEPIGALMGSNHEWADRTALPLAELAGQPLWFPMTGAPLEWVELLDDLSRTFSLSVDYSGSTMGFDHFLQRLHTGHEVSFYGLGMPEPRDPEVRVVPLVEPVPVFAWSLMWRRRLHSDALIVLSDIVEHARAVTPEPHPADAWMPSADRARLTEDQIVTVAPTHP